MQSGKGMFRSRNVFALFSHLSRRTEIQSLSNPPFVFWFHNNPDPLWGKDEARPTFQRVCDKQTAEKISRAQENFPGAADPL